MLELEDKLLERPGDMLASQVWADRLCELGDPRGELVALDHGITLALTAANPAHALDLSARRAELYREHFAEIFDRPGGYPFRDRYLGRCVIYAPFTFRRPSLQAEFPRLQLFARQLTTVEGPTGVRLVDMDRPAGSPAPGEPGRLELQFRQALEPAKVTHSDDLWYVWRTEPAQPLADEALLGELAARTPSVTLMYRFQLTWPGTKVPLPYQESGHYPGEGSDQLTSMLSFSGGAGLQGSFFLPFEDPADPAAELVRNAARLRLEPLVGAGFLESVTVLEPSADGAQLVPRRD